MAPCPSSGIIIHGDADEIIPIDSVDKLNQKLSSQKNISIEFQIIKGGDHSFAGQVDTLNGHVEAYLNKALTKAA